MVLDACCGGRKFWFNKNNPIVIYMDKRKEELKVNDSSKKLGYRILKVQPDIVADFTDMPFDDETFWHVVLDPPHLTSLGVNSWMAQTYGRLDNNWRTLIGKGFEECMRVLKTNGTLIMKWNEHDVKLSELLEVLKGIGHEPLYGHTTGRQSKTIWLAFIKTQCDS